MHDKVLEKLNGLTLSADIVEARKEAVEIISLWEWTKKMQATIDTVNKTTSVDKITQILWNTALSGAGLKVLRT